MESKSELINRVHFKKKLIESEEYMGCADCKSGGFLTILNLLDAEKTVDAVEVIRCGECRFFSEFPYDKENGNCVYKSIQGDCYPCRVTKNDYCSFARERG